MNPLIKWILLYVLTLVLFLIIDLCWLGWLAKDLYKKQLGHLMTDKVNWTAALIFYGIFISALLFFVIQPAIEKKDLGFALLSGAFFGLVTYATYDLTNLATLKSWPQQIVYIDICWGTVLCTLVSGGGYYLHKWIIG
jgi:uncharacterized membrane protein